MQTRYRVNRENQIIQIGGAWDQFAELNDAHNLSGRKVIGLPLMRFISGDATRMFIEVMLRSARLRGQSFSKHYRCDSAEMRRLMCMTLFPEENHEVELMHEILEETPLPTPVQCYEAPMAMRHRCSICNRLATDDGQWIDPALPGLHRYINLNQRVAVQHTVCDDCLLHIHDSKPHANQLHFSRINPTR
jgi:hypothetical protein